MAASHACLWVSVEFFVFSKTSSFAVCFVLWCDQTSLLNCVLESECAAFVVVVAAVVVVVVVVVVLDRLLPVTEPNVLVFICACM